METHIVDSYLAALLKAKTDNEKFAALLMIAKVTKDSTCGKDEKRRILEAIGLKFFSRLLKTKNVPEGCPENIFKSVALSILSALSGDPDVTCSPSMTDNVTNFNLIILLNPSETEQEDRQLVDDTYECLNSLCRTKMGQESLVRAKSLSALSQAVVDSVYGWEKAMDILVAILSSSGSEAWVGCETGLHSLMGHFGKEFRADMSARKFELCKTLIFLLTTMPRHLVKTIDPPWADDIVSGLNGILRSKLGSPQREPALKLTAMLIDVCGIQSVIPPVVSDSKLFLLITHLSCVEVRMVLEDSDLQIALQKGRLLSSCYSILETIINHMTSGPSLQLDDRQVMQLHSAMVGAFSAVLHFLRRISEDCTIKWDSVVLATVRVLAAWLSEETSALRNEVYELIPFLVDISKKSVPSYEEVIEKENRLKKSSGADNSSPRENKCDNDNHVDNSDVVIDSLSETLDKALNIVKPSASKSKHSEIEKHSVTDDTGQAESTENHDRDIVCDDDKQTDQNLEEFNQNSNTDTHIVLKESEENTQNLGLDENSNNSEEQSLDCETKTDIVPDEIPVKPDLESKKHVSFNNSSCDYVTNHDHVTAEDESYDRTVQNDLDQSRETDMGESRHSPKELNDSGTNTEQNLALVSKNDEVLSKEPLGTIDSFVNDSSEQVDAEMNEKELQDLHIRVDIFRFLLPGLCHLTSEDLPRMVLIKEGILALLDLYMWRQWNLFNQNPQSREVQSSLVILCNILLNLVIIEPKLVVEREEFCHVLLLVVKAAKELELEDGYLVVWSHIVTLGLMLLRALSKKVDNFLEAESVNRFFISAVRFLSGAYTVEFKKKLAAGITISEGYRQTWDQICQTWFLSMQAFCACVPLFSELPSVILKTGWIPALLKSLLQVKGRGVEDETRSCFLLLLATVASNNKAIRDVVREKGGEDLARMYKSKDLEEALKKK